MCYYYSFIEHFNTLPHTLTLEYAMVPNTNTIGKLDTLTRNRKSKPDASPSHSSSLSPQHLSNDSLYSPVRDSGPTAAKRKISIDSKSPSPPPPLPPVYPKATLYDHLTPRSKRKMIEQQVNTSPSARNSFETPESVYSLAEDVPRGPLQPDVPPQYSSFNNTQIRLGQLQNELHFVTEGLDQPGNYSSLNRSQSPTAIYDFCENPEPQATCTGSSNSLPKPLSMQSYNVKTVDGSPSPQRRPHQPYIQPDYSSVPNADSIGLYDYASLPQTTKYSIRTQSHEGTPEAIYSLADEMPTITQQRPAVPPRQSPLMVKRSVTPPPLLHPKANTIPIDTSFLTKTTSGSSSQKTTPSHTPILSHAIEHVTPLDDNPELIYAIPDTRRRRSPPKIQHVAPIDNPEAIYALPDMTMKRDATPIGLDEDDDDDDDIAPPLPPRNYDTSDIEVRAVH